MIKFQLHLYSDLQPDQAKQKVGRGFESPWRPNFSHGKLSKITENVEKTSLKSIYFAHSYWGILPFKYLFILILITEV